MSGAIKMSSGDYDPSSRKLINKLLSLKSLHNGRSGPFYLGAIFPNDLNKSGIDPENIIQIKDSVQQVINKLPYNIFQELCKKQFWFSPGLVFASRVF